MAKVTEARPRAPCPASVETVEGSSAVPGEELRQGRTAHRAKTTAPQPSPAPGFLLVLPQLGTHPGAMTWMGEEFCFLFKIFHFVFERQRDRHIFHPLVQSPCAPNNQVEPGLPCEWQGTKPLCHHLLPPRRVSRKLDQRWSGRVLNRCSYGLWAS